MASSFFIFVVDAKYHDGAYSQGWEYNDFVYVISCCGCLAYYISRSKAKTLFAFRMASMRCYFQVKVLSRVISKYLILVLQFTMLFSWVMLSGSCVLLEHCKLKVVYVVKLRCRCSTELV